MIRYIRVLGAALGGFTGLALAYQQSVKVFADTADRRRVLKAFERTLETMA